MFNPPVLPSSKTSVSQENQTDQKSLVFPWLNLSQRSLMFCAASFLVSVPVFIQAPLVRLNPWFTLTLTLGWIILSWKLWKSPQTRIWGDLLLGFSWSWFAGAIYWGWLRWEPFYHLPIEAIALPIVLWLIKKRWLMIGNLFYLGSLFGTIITDLYFYITNLIPYWRKLMQVDENMANYIFQEALNQMQTFWGISWAVVFVNILLGTGLIALQGEKTYWLAFAGAVLSTLFVDSLFWVAAYFA